jgi:hypothetical protein
MPKKNYRLWTPIANALEAYRRRVLAEPGAVYEHTWRLIHIHEALVVTLGSILATRLLNLWQNQAESQGDLNSLRVQVTGIPDSEQDNDASSYSTESCLGGSIKAWIYLLQRFGRKEFAPSCEFCVSLSEYLSDQSQGQLAFFESWKRISPGSTIYMDNLPRVQRFDAINTLRNKIAHVPLPHRILEELHSGLRKEVLSSLSPKYEGKTDDPLSDFTKVEWAKPLAGRITSGRFYLTGSEIGQNSQLTPGDDVYVEPQSIGVTELVPWQGGPFLRVDRELKASLLFRVPDLRTDPLSESFASEYHRFAAEVEPVQKHLILRREIQSWIPVPVASTAGEPEPSEPHLLPVSEPVTISQTANVDFSDMSSSELRSKAEDAFRVRDYQQAVSVFDALSRTQDPRWYNDVAKSKHGAALWRAIEHAQVAENPEKGIERAIGLLDEASRHRDPRYAARALYEKSKALWHLWRRRQQDGDLLKRAIQSAGEASKLDFDPAYISWFERIGYDAPE